MRRFLKLFLNVLFILLSIITLILSLTFIFIEGRLLISLDWIIYDAFLLGFIRYFFRLLLAIYVFITTILGLINLKKKNNILDNYFLIFNISQVVMSIILLIFVPNFLGEIALTLLIIILLNKLALVYVK